MFLHAKDKMAYNYRVKDAETGKVINHVLWADDEVGRYAVYLYHENGEPMFDEYDDIIVEEFTGKIIVEKKS